MVNTVLNTIVAEKFAEFSDAIDAGKDVHDLARESLNENWKVIFNGNNYCEEAQQELTDRGIWRIDSGVEAIATLTAHPPTPFSANANQKNIQHGFRSDPSNGKLHPPGGT